MRPFAFLAISLTVVTACQAQDVPPITFEEYTPPSTLVVPATEVTSAKYPFIDVHAHQGRAGSMSAAEVDGLVQAMDGLNMRVMVNLSGGSGDELSRRIRSLEGAYPGRFATFANVDFDGIGEPGWGERAAAQLEADVAGGARGLKIFKSLGMYVTDETGARVRTDDARIDPVWRKCGELGIPVLIHTGDPAPFWQPHDAENERWLELKERPNRKRPPEPSWEQIMSEQHAVFRRHPETIFVDAHLGWLGNDLDRLGRLLDELPNVYTEVGAVLAELGRQPRHARDFLIRYKDRVLFGKDAWEPSEYHVYFRVFETADEYFDYYRRRHAFWKLYGLDLPDDVLKHIYYKNALRLIPGLDAASFPE